jgi:hypothetical protein
LDIDKHIHGIHNGLTLTNGGHMQKPDTHPFSTAKGIHTKASHTRQGTFTVTDHLLRESINSGLAARLFYGSVPLDIKRNWIAQTTTYTLWHPKFDQLREGSLIPTYTAEIENGVISWHRQDAQESSPAPFGQEQWDKLVDQQRVASTAQQGGAA